MGKVSPNLINKAFSISLLSWRVITGCPMFSVQDIVLLYVVKLTVFTVPIESDPASEIIVSLTACKSHLVRH